ncbi:hypothetical protein [Teichococcus aestuarii]
MFTGIITAQGQVAEVTPIGGGQDMRLVIAAPEGWLEGPRSAPPSPAPAAASPSSRATSGASPSRSRPRRWARPRSASGGRAAPSTWSAP